MVETPVTPPRLMVETTSQPPLYLEAIKNRTIPLVPQPPESREAAVRISWPPRGGGCEKGGTPIWFPLLTLHSYATAAAREAARTCPSRLFSRLWKQNRREMMFSYTGWDKKF